MFEDKLGKNYFDNMSQLFFFKNLFESVIAYK